MSGLFGQAGTAAGGADETEGVGVDLRGATEVAESVKRLACRRFGFREHLVRPLEADQRDPERYCLFEVRGTTYRVERGAISVAGEES